MALALIPYIALIVGLDSLTPSPDWQHWLFIPTAAWLWLWSRRLEDDERLELWLCVAVSGALELILTELWGLYSYRYGFVPLYVFPGHGLLWLMARDAQRWLPALRREKTIAYAVSSLAVVWGLAGLILRPRAGLPPDVHGALYAPICLPLLLRSDRRLAYAATFMMTSGLELLGTALGTWHWSPRIPDLGFPAGDPPTLIAGGYFIFAFTARLLADAWASQGRPALEPGA